MRRSLLEMSARTVIKNIKDYLKITPHYIIAVGLLFYFLTYFVPNNKVFLLLFVLFFLIFFQRFKDGFLTSLFLYCLFLPFNKGKAFYFNFLPDYLLGSKQIQFGAVITFADLAIIFALLFLYKKRFSKKEENFCFKTNKADFFIIAFLLFTFMASFSSQFSLYSLLTWIKLLRAVMSYYLIRVFLARYSPKKSDLIRIFYFTFLYESLWACVQFLRQGKIGRSVEPLSSSGMGVIEDPTFFRSQGTFSQPNNLGIFLAMWLVFFSVYFLKKRNFLKGVWRLVFLFGFLGLVFSGSRAAWASLAIFFIINFYLNRKEIIKKIKNIKIARKKILIWGTLVTLPLLFIIIPRLEHFYAVIWGEAGFSFRQYLSRKAWQVAKQKPFGIGIGVFPLVLIQQFRTHFNPAPVHNLFLEVLVEGGVLSLVAFIFFLLFLGRNFFKNNKLANKEKLASLLAVLTFLFFAQFHSSLWSSLSFNYFWLLIGFMIS